MPKTKYVFTCLIWLLRCPLGTIHAVDTNTPTSLLLTKSPENAMTSVPTPTTQEAAQTTLQEKGSTTDTERHPLDPTTLPEEVKSSHLPDLLANPEEAPSSSDSTAQDTASEEPEGPIQFVIWYDAVDSMVFDVKHKTIHLHGAGIIEHDTIKLEAEEVLLDWTHHTIAAFSKKNEAGEVEKKAVLTRDGIEYIAESVRYNFNSQRAVANKLFTKQEDGILRANKIKKDRETTFYADQCTYTTCNLVKPHFHADAQQLKLIQDDKVVSGPFKLHFDDVPTPLGFIFGIFYFPQGSGIIFPKYGGESDKGFCLKDGGYYINFNDYVDLALQGEIYSKGSTGFTAQSRYKKRYQYSGELIYQRSTALSSSEAQLFKKEKSWRFQWNHRTENNRTSSLTAEVDLQSQSFRTQNTLPSSERLQASMNSSIRYTNKLIGLPYTLNANLRHAKNFQTQEASATIPGISLRTENIYPFRKKGGSGGNWYSDIYFQHRVDFENKLSNIIGQDTLDFSPENWPVLFKNGKYGVKHTVPLKTNVKILGYLNLTPAIQYQERWYWEKINYRYNADRDKIQEKVRGFERVYDYNLSAGLTTTLYGTHFFGRHATIQAIRHEIEPAVSFTYTPDFSDPKYGYWQTMEDGEKLNRFKGATYGAPTDRATAVMQVNLNNRLDMKVKSDAEGKESTKKVPILEGFNWSTSYDFLAESRALDDIQLRTWTHLFNDLFNISFNATFDPYLPQKDNQDSTRAKDKPTRIDEFAWNHGQGIGRVKQASLSISTRLSPGGRDSTLDQYSDLEDNQEVKEEVKHIQEHPEQYVDFKIPWSLHLNYEWHYSSLTPEQQASTKVLSFNGDTNLTENWKITLSSAYDITKQELVGTATNIGIYRDLHCWEMNFNWRPLGDTQYYEFTVGVKSPLLQDLKYSRNRSYKDL